MIDQFYKKIIDYHKVYQFIFSMDRRRNSTWRKWEAKNSWIKEEKVGRLAFTKAEHASTVTSIKAKSWGVHCRYQINKHKDNECWGRLRRKDYQEVFSDWKIANIKEYTKKEAGRRKTLSKYEVLPSSLNWGDHIKS